MIDFESKNVFISTRLVQACSEESAMRQENKETVSKHRIDDISTVEPMGLHLVVRLHSNERMYMYIPLKSRLPKFSYHTGSPSLSSPKNPPEKHFSSTYNCSQVSHPKWLHADWEVSPTDSGLWGMLVSIMWLEYLEGGSPPHKIWFLVFYTPSYM